MCSWAIDISFYHSSLWRSVGGLWNDKITALFWCLFYSEVTHICVVTYACFLDKWLCVLNYWYSTIFPIGSWCSWHPDSLKCFGDHRFECGLTMPANTMEIKEDITKYKMTIDTIFMFINGRNVIQPLGFDDYFVAELGLTAKMPKSATCSPRIIISGDFTTKHKFQKDITFGLSNCVNHNFHCYLLIASQLSLFLSHAL